MAAVPLRMVRLKRLLGSRIVFISYRRSDSADISGRIFDRLVTSGRRQQVIRDVNSIPLGVDYRDYIRNVIPLCGVVLAVIGPSWKHEVLAATHGEFDAEDLVRTELHAALEHGVRVIPLLVGGAEMPTPGELPSDLCRIADRQALAIRGDPDFHWDLDRLISQL